MVYSLRRFMKLYSYIITHDSGFSPNPFWGFCTLACCKPSIRRTARMGDWIVGLSPKKDNYKIIYAMEITEKPITYRDYYSNKRFINKIPDMTKKEVIYKTGDNIYKPVGDDFIQLHSKHSNPDGTEDIDNKNHDLKGIYVLISDDFYYFGSGMIELPDKLKFLIVGRNHRNNYSTNEKNSFLNFIKNYDKCKIKYPPNIWKDGDYSWKGSY
jgi:hypothetical protein